MRGIIVTAGAALLVAVPAAMGLVGNTSFAQSVPVRVPQQASVLDDNDRPTPHVATGDDNGGQRSPSAVEPGDDNGGLVTQVEPATGKVSDSGTATDDNGGHGGDTSGSDTSGSGGKDDGSGHS